MEDNLIVTYDSNYPDEPTLVVARKNNDNIKIINEFQGDLAFGTYCLLTDMAMLKEHYRHAKWERPVLINGHWYRRCTGCLYDSPHGAADNKEFMPQFCSNCGAIMDLE